ncbi:MAG: transcriptional regulator PpsR [Bosea sp.]|nr:transcriptional regulator PpsR [Bosea sp. (in: a-proteobacteria)]
MKKLDHPSNAVVHIDPAVAARIVMASADVAVIMDQAGIVRDVLLAAEARLPSEFGAWLGRPWLETVSLDSKPKAQQLLADAAAGLPGRLREINHIVAAGAATVPIRYSAMKLDDAGQILAVGRDLRALAGLQQQLVQFQQSMEREYGRLRAADTRYRVLFQLTGEPILIADSSGRRITEANPAAIALIGLPPGRITGRVLPSLFADKGGDALQDMLTVASNGGRGAAYGLTLAENGARVAAQASLFRQDGAACFLIRLTGPSDRERGDGPATTAIEALIDRLPDAFVVTDAAGALQRVNGAFLDMAGLATAGAAVGQNLDQWLGRAGVDFNVLKASMREGGVVRNFSTVLRSAYGAVDTVEISAVGGIGDAADHLGFIIRPAGRSGSEPGPSALPRSAEEFKQLVGRVPLKELVRETSDIIEKLCIEAALEMTGNNRASAADMLGLSRQGLYAKLHRFGIGDLSGQD